jgi:uncharacterized protein YcgI (DUF1989 family)
MLAPVAAAVRGEGEALFSTVCRPMMLLVKETATRKGSMTSITGCATATCMSPPAAGAREGSLEITSKARAAYGILPEDIPDPLYVFMNYEHDVTKGRWVINEPVTGPNDYIEFKALMDCIVGLSNCPDDVVKPNERVDVHLGQGGDLRLVEWAEMERMASFCVCSRPWRRVVRRRDSVFESEHEAVVRRDVHGDRLAGAVPHS